MDRVLKQRLGINEPTVSVGSTTLFEEGDGADDRLKVNLEKLLKVKKGLGKGGLVMCDGSLHGGEGLPC